MNKHDLVPVVTTNPLNNSYCNICKQLTIEKIVQIYTLKLNLWLTALRGVTPLNYISATDWQMTERRDNVIIITLQV